MGNLKYNPLLKLNLQEETDASEIIGDGYNEKLLTWNDFLNDIDTILVDTFEIRKYYLTNSVTASNLGSKVVNFSCMFICNEKSISFVNSPLKFQGKFLIFYQSSGLTPSQIDTFSPQTYIYDCRINFQSGTAVIGNYYTTVLMLINCYYSQNGTIAIQKRGPDTQWNVIAIGNAKNHTLSLTTTNTNKFTLISDGTIKYLGGFNNFAGYINIDDELNISSPGLLKNSTITAALQALQPDSTLDADSNKPVMNSAVTQEINTITEIIENFQDINVSTLQEFENAIQTGQNANVRIHLTTDITLTQSVSYNLDKIQIYGHDNKINLQNFTFTIQGETAYFNAVRFNANSSVNATTAANYSNAQINIISTVNSARFFFEYVIFMNFFCKSSDNSTTDFVKTFFDVQNSAGTSYPSLHLYFTFCEIMTNYTQSNINSLCAGINHSGSLHALTVHNIDFWGNNKEANSCPNWTVTGNSLSGLAKLGWISDGSAIYAQRTNSLTPSFVNQYNPSNNEFLTLKNSFTFQTYNDSKINSYTSSQVEAYTTVYYNNYIAIVKFYTQGTGNIPPGAFTNKIPIKLIDSLQLDSNVQVNAEADGFTLISVNQTAPGMYGTFTMPILQN